ncbi:OmpA family protein [Winogradskyella immobilis]|uniref:OmpA family protein n=1 Tax=Winogradskyella immobilis TaxID=2816852 RepID=A0ABS8EJR8_9FLAO|nr:OmpA family protein [Winogradskyella immobilis]MCC1483436.1 OmpA family protein [Winogradskyella immobilis]MCG0015530.1 OmpA family protein [Winogradskyella immobilis]
MRLFVLITFLSLQFAFSQKEMKHIVYFETDKYTILETEHYRLLLFLSEIESIDVKKISIYGFCDDRGSDSYNLKLSKNRANAIKTVFSNNEVDDNLITNIDGKGEILLNIIKETNVQKIRALNRKVEIVVTQVFPPRKTILPNTKVEELLTGDLKVGDNIQIENLLFKTGYSYLVPESIEVLNRIAAILLQRRDISFTIQGHVCCTNGTRDALDRKTKKRNLSVARAKYVYDFLANKGVSRNRMKYVGLKRKYPLGGLPEYDRRVELLITAVKK